MRRIVMAAFALVIGALGSQALLRDALAQAQVDPAAPAQSPPADASAEQQQATWTGLPFVSLADFERLIPIGMRRNDLFRTLGRPAMTMPGRGSDQVHHYEYDLADGSRINATVIVRDGAVFIRRLYISSPTGETSRAN